MALVRIGKIIRLHGFKGELTLRLDVTSSADYKGLQTIYLGEENAQIPYEVQLFEPKSLQNVKLKLAGIDTEIAAKSLSGSWTWIEDKDLSKPEAFQYENREAVGYVVIDKTLGDIGRVAEYMELPGNPVLRVLRGFQEILIPAVPQFILQMDPETRTIQVDLPDGMVDLNGLNP